MKKRAAMLELKRVKNDQNPELERRVRGASIRKRNVGHAIFESK